MMDLTRVYHFSAAHRLENPAFSAEDNARRYGPCCRPSYAAGGDRSVMMKCWRSTLRVWGCTVFGWTTRR